MNPGYINNLALEKGRRGIIHPEIPPDSPAAPLRLNTAIGPFFPHSYNDFLAGSFPRQQDPEGRTAADAACRFGVRESCYSGLDMLVMSSSTGTGINCP
jgi:hypothetical protein